MLHPLAVPTLTWPLWVNNLGYREIRLGCLHPTGCVYTCVVRHVRLCTIQPRVRFYENLKQSLSREANSESSREVIIPWAWLSLHITRRNRQNHLFAVFCTCCFILLCPRGIVMNNNETWRDCSSCCSNIALLLSGLKNTLLSQFQVYFFHTEYSVSSLLNFHNILLFKRKI